MRRIFSTVSSQTTIFRRTMSSELLISTVVTLQKEFTTSKSKESLEKIKQLLEQNSLDDVNEGGMTLERAKTLSNFLVTVRVAPPRVSPAIQSFYAWCLSAEVVGVMTADVLARVLHGAVITHSPSLVDLLMKYVWRVVELCPSMDGVSCSTIINAYGRSGFKHAALYQALVARACKTIKEDAVTLAHVANVAHALSRVGVDDKALFLQLRDQSVKHKAQASPLMMASLLESFSKVSFVEDELFATFEARLESLLETCSPSLLATILSTLCNANHHTTSLFTATTARTTALAATFDCASIAKVLESLLKVNVSNEDLFGSLAERSCKIVSEFLASECSVVLQTLSHFALFDPELFPLLGGRVVSLIKQQVLVDPKDLAVILSSFAAVNERHDELLNAALMMMNDAILCITLPDAVHVLFAMGVFNVRSDFQKAVLQHVKTNIAQLTEMQKIPLFKPKVEYIRQRYLSD